MAFVNRIGNVLKQTVSKHVNVESCASNSMLYQAIRSMSTKLFVGGLSYGTDEASLSQAFSQHGEVVEARVIIDRDNGRSRGFGFVTFASNEDAARAMQALDGQDLHGRRIRVNYATEKPRAPRYDGGYGGGDGYGYGGSQSGPYGGGGYDRGNFGGSNYGGGMGGNFGSGNSAYSGGGNFRDVGAGGGNDFFSGGSSNPGGVADSGYDGNTSPGYGGAQEQLNDSQSENTVADEDGPQAPEGDYKDDDDDEPNDYANRRG